MNKIKDLLRYKSGDVWTVHPGATVYEALELMAEKNIGALPVVEEGRLVGIFSEHATTHASAFSWVATPGKPSFQSS